MYRTLCFLVVVLLGVGCRSGSGGGNGARVGDEAPLWQNGEDEGGQSTQARATAQGNEGDPVIIPITSGTGIVATVNGPLRFVVLDFALNPLPKVDQQLFLYRRGQKVARVKVTGPIRGQTVAADIVEGNAERGDEVRPD